MNRSRWRRFVRDGWLLAVVALVVAGAAWVTKTSADGHATATELQSVRDTDRLTHARLTFERSAVRILVDLLADGTGAWDADPQALAAAEEYLQESFAEIEALADGEGRAAELATVVVEAIDRSAVDDPTGNAVELYDAVDSVRWATASLMPDAPYDALFELGFFVALPEHMLVETVTAIAQAEGATVDPAIRDLFDEVASVIANDGGWLGLDPAAPLTDSEWFDIDTARAGLPEVTDEVEQVFATSRLLESDAWMRDLGAGIEPPTELDDLRAVSADVRAAVAGLVDPLLQVEGAAAVDRAEDSNDSRRLLDIVTLALALTAGVMLAVAIVLMSRRRRAERRLFDLALVDPVTGASSRHVLDTRVRPLVEAGRNQHHVVVVVDLDRFKMVNDAFGHAVGDELLREIAGRLRVAGESVAAAAGGTTEVVRMGGDEFLLTVHAPGDVPIDLLRAELDVARRRPFPIKVDGRVEPVVPGFSIGITDVSGAGDLDAMIATADLEAYADKADRLGERRVNDRRLGDRRAGGSGTPIDDAADEMPSH